MVFGLNKLKKAFTSKKSNTDIEILRNRRYCNRMKYLLVTLRNQYKSKYLQVLASGKHKGTHDEQEIFISTLSAKIPDPTEMLEDSMRKQFLKDFPQYADHVKTYCVEILD